MVCLRNISVDTLHKGDTNDDGDAAAAADDDDNNNTNNNKAGNHEVKERQKTAILGTAHILRKVLT
jgi:hypothetical protein